MTERNFLVQAVEMMTDSECKTPADPKVGAVLARDGKLIDSQEHTLEGHAEFLLLKRFKKEELRGATLYTTLEPCTFRGITDQGEPKISCVDLILEHQIRRVVIGMLDPNPFILGNGVQLLREHAVEVALFPCDLVETIEKSNQPFREAFNVVSKQQIDICGRWLAHTTFDTEETTEEELFLAKRIGNRVYGVMHNLVLNQKYNFYLMSMAPNVWDYIFRAKPSAKRLDHGAGVLMVDDYNTARGIGVAHGTFATNRECVGVTVKLERVK